MHKFEMDLRDDMIDSLGIDGDLIVITFMGGHSLCITDESGGHFKTHNLISKLEGAHFKNVRTCRDDHGDMWFLLLETSHGTVLFSASTEQSHGAYTAMNPSFRVVN